MTDPNEVQPGNHPCPEPYTSTVSLEAVHALLRRTPMDGEVFIALKDGVDALAVPPKAASVAGETVWGIAESDDTERWVGAYKSRQEAIDAGRDSYGNDKTFWIAMGRRPSPAEFLPDIDWLLEEMGNAAEGAAGEASDDFPDVSDVERHELEELLTAWAEKNIEVSFWIADGHTEEIPLEEEEVDD